MAFGLRQEVHIKKGLGFPDPVLELTRRSSLRFSHVDQPFIVSFSYPGTQTVPVSVGQRVGPLVGMKRRGGGRRGGEGSRRLGQQGWGVAELVVHRSANFLTERERRRRVKPVTRDEK